LRRSEAPRLVRITASSALMGFLRAMPGAAPASGPTWARSCGATKLKFTASQKPAASRAWRTRSVTWASWGSAGFSLAAEGSVSGMAW
jgi:hypothetical protein